VGDAASEVSKRGREGLADGLGVSAEGLDLVSSCVVDGDELSHTGQDSLVGLGLGSEDGREVAPVVDEVDADGVTTVGIARKRVWVEEHAIANRGGWAGGAVGVEVLVVHLANATGDTRSEERRHEIDVGTDERRVLCKSALVEDGLESVVIRVTKELVELAAEDGTADLFLGEELRVGRSNEELSSRMWGHEVRRASPDVVGLQGASAEMLGGWVQDSHSAVGSDAVGESFAGQISQADKLYLGGREVVDRNERRQVRLTAVSGIDDATVGTTDWKGFREQDRVDEIEEVEGAGERCSTVHVPLGLEVGRRARGAKHAEAVALHEVIHVCGVVSGRDDGSGRSDRRCCGCSGEEDGISSLDLLLRWWSSGGGRGRLSGYVGSSCSWWDVELFPALVVACKAVTKWLLRLARNYCRERFLAQNASGS